MPRCLAAEISGYASDDPRGEITTAGDRDDVEAGVLFSSGERRRTQTDAYIVCAAGG